ncbi:MAG: hypothetical protein HY868_05725 [Chloroflexi bacterium]|nr:hypothetical protein [Chloroflexota bacterium]
MNEKPNNQPVRVLPDPQICRAAALADRFAECLVEKPASCEFAMPFGYGFVCGHPERQTIIAHTRKLREQNLQPSAEQSTLV